MALKGVLSLDLSGTGKLKSLFGTGFGLHFGHLFLVKLKIAFSLLLSGLGGDEHRHPFPFQPWHLLYLSVIFKVCRQSEQ